MKKTVVVFVPVIILASSALPAHSAVISLKGWTYYLDGVIYDSSHGGPMPVEGTLTDGLGVLTWTTGTAGSHTFIACYDYDLDAGINGFSNEYAMARGAISQGQSWEIDESGYVFGDIYDNTLAGILDNTDSLMGSAEDVSLALGWDFVLDEGEVALITLLIMDHAQESGFFLEQHDPDSDATIYFSSTLDIAAAPVPEPGSVFLFGAGLLSLYGSRKLFLSRDIHA